MTASPGRRVAAEALGSGLLVAVVVGSGIQATELTRDMGVQLLANSLATVFGLGVLILLLGPVSGAHFNPAVTLAAWFTARRTADGLTLRDVAAYVPAQIAGAIGGTILVDAMFAKPLVKLSTQSSCGGLGGGRPRTVAAAVLPWATALDQKGVRRLGRVPSPRR
ncbi:aquaporin [Streptomyces sp. enrichment culture]|uniref:aquaporin n=1 Tax=Streptomyces sp. enrichment culture TaxID=1795815 RepID=UPI003F54624D